MGKVLGLDLGTNSIGWAVVENEVILGMGSRIFPEGVTNLGEGEGREMSKNASRTDDRGVRRQIYRRRMRKQILLNKLSENRMCPLSASDLKEWKQSKKFPESKLKNWFKLNPYELRHKALYEKLTLEEVGRVFYHLIQRRGFQSNSRKQSKEDGAIFKGDLSSNKIGIDETRNKIENKTLGEYLYSISPKKEAPFQDGLERVRNRYTTRQMYIDEFDEIWRGQSKFHETMTTDLRAELGGRIKEGDQMDGVIFHQRPLKSQKHLLGKCSFEPGKSKCPKSALIFEEFRCYQWLNTVECDGVRLNEEEQDAILKLMFKKDKFKFKDARKVINKIAVDFKFNYKDDDTISGTYTISNLSNKKFFGAEWYSFSEKKQNDIWHIIHFFEDKDKLYEYAINNWSFEYPCLPLGKRLTLPQYYSYKRM